MQFRSSKTSSRTVHDRSRGMIRERSRKHFLTEAKERDHELAYNQEELRKLQNEDFEFDQSIRLEDRYSVRFIRRETGERRELAFRFESNYVKLEPLWSRKH